jgi:D-alanyl-lipoteichoic acid acyltransferase DltB (MBOAT superfamily)
VLFNSFEFTFFFLPLTYLAYFAARRYAPVQVALAVLTVLSLVFYAWWNVSMVWVMVASILFNFALGKAIARSRASLTPLATPLFVAALAVDLAVLVYFKYWTFFESTFYSATGHPGVRIPEIVLPLGISFFTFQQIDFLVDVWNGRVKEQPFLHYCLFVTFFPHLIAGPIVRHSEMMPQFLRTPKLRRMDLAVGMTLFAVGLAKKVLLADHLSEFANPMFSAVAEGHDIGTLVAWCGAIDYMLQLYFDFSGYSDMAIGVARMLGIRLPLNFNSPYKASSIIDFWQRWHMTLTRFFNTHLYNPVSLRLTRWYAKRRGLHGGRPPLREFGVLLALPTMITMGLIGMWHGAGFQFLLFGVLHGGFLVANHAWRRYRPRRPGREAGASTAIPGQLLTLLCVLIAFVFFRADSIPTALHVLARMGTLNPALSGLTRREIGWTAISAAVALIPPNSQQLIGPFMNYGRARYTELATTVVYKVERPIYAWLRWRPTLLWSSAAAALFTISVLRFSYSSQFLYFGF